MTSQEIIKSQMDMLYKAGYEIAKNKSLEDMADEQSQQEDVLCEKCGEFTSRKLLNDEFINWCKDCQYSIQ